eukprot:GILK01002996.1.p1 GENE.GILK01002996.1~~GILK01002996.1.p1  ORF type:complete len:171 (+),score=25.71 GILK01002996.1:33-545(+)
MGQTVARAQAPALDVIRPGSWAFPGFHSANATWTVSAAEGKTLLSNLADSVRKNQLEHFHLRELDPQANSAKFYFYTPKIKWLDIVEIKLASQNAEQAVFDVRSFSSSFLPASVPLAPLLTFIFVIVPFGDGGQNLLHIKALSKHLLAQGIRLDEHFTFVSRTTPKRLMK